MIHIIDEYYVDGGAHDYTLTKKTNSVNKKGNTIYDRLDIISACLTPLRASERLCQGN